MRVLALSTSTSQQGVCLRLPGCPPLVAIESLRRGAPRTLDRRIFELLRAQGLGPADLDLIAVDVGPGSFTGLRIGLAAARTLAWAHGVATVAVGSLQAMIAAARPVAEPSSALLALLPSRRGVIYAGLANAGLEEGAPCSAEGEVALSELPTWLRSAGLEVDQGVLRLLGAKAPIDLARPALEAAGFETLEWAQPPTGSLGPDPLLVAVIGQREAEAGRLTPALSLEPRYLAISEAERMAGAPVLQRSIQASRQRSD